MGYMVMTVAGYCTRFAGSGQGNCFDSNRETDSTKVAYRVFAHSIMLQYGKIGNMREGEMTTSNETNVVVWYDYT